MPVGIVIMVGPTAFLIRLTAYLVWNFKILLDAYLNGLEHQNCV